MRYVSDKVISFSIRVEGKAESVRVNFTARATGGSTFTTQYPALIEAMEKSSMYNKVYRRAPECVCMCGGKKKKKEQKSSDKDRITLVTHVQDWQDAIEYLTDTCKCDSANLSSPDDILSEAARCGVKFPNLCSR